MKETMKIWIPGLPATFATRGEKPWKETLREYIEQSSSDIFQGVNLTFILPTMAPHKHPLDLDNLCEPVFSITSVRLRD